MLPQAASLAFAGLSRQVPWTCVQLIERFTNLILLHLTCCELSNWSPGPEIPAGWYYLLSVPGAWKPLGTSVSSSSSSASVHISPSFSFAANVPAEAPLSRFHSRWTLAFLLVHAENVSVFLLSHLSPLPPLLSGAPHSYLQASCYL